VSVDGGGASSSQDISRFSLCGWTLPLAPPLALRLPRPLQRGLGLVGVLGLLAADFGRTMVKDLLLI